MSSPTLDWFLESIPSTFVTNQGDELAPPGVKWAGLVQANCLQGNGISYLSGFAYVGCFLETVGTTSAYHLCGWSYGYPSNGNGSFTSLISNTIPLDGTISTLNLTVPLRYSIPSGAPIVINPPPPSTSYPPVTLLTNALAPAGSTTISVVPQTATIAYTGLKASITTIESLSYVDLGVINLVDATTKAVLSGAITGIAIVPLQSMGAWPPLGGNGPTNEVVVFLWEQGSPPADLPAYTLDPANPGNGLTEWYCPGWQFNYEPYSSLYDGIIPPDAGYPGALFPPTNTTTMLPIVSAIGPSGPGPNILSGAAKMYVYGPTTSGTEWWTIGVQGCDADGSNPTPIYFYTYYTNNANHRQVLTFSQYPFSPVYDNGQLGTDAASHNVMWGSSNITQSGSSFYIYAPVGKGEYGFFENIESGSGWVQSSFTTDVQSGFFAALGTGVDSPSSTLAFIVGNSPSQGRVVAAYSGLDNNQGTWLFNYANPTGYVTDGNLDAGLIVNPVCIVDDNLTNDVFPIFLDDGPFNGQPIPLLPLTEWAGLLADYGIVSPPNPQGTRTPWFRQIVDIFYNKVAAKGLAPLRMFQRSDSFGVRQFQLSGSANSPLSVRSQSAGATHV